MQKVAFADRHAAINDGRPAHQAPLDHHHHHHHHHHPRPVPSRLAALGVDSSVPAFLQNLFLMVHDEDTDQHIAWAPNGESFLVRASMEFASKVMPLYFNHGNFDTFVRQLSYYGFRKIGRGDNTHHFAHPNFQRGKPALIKEIKRRTMRAPSPTKKRKLEVVEQVQEHALARTIQQLEHRVEEVECQNSQLRQEMQALVGRQQMLMQAFAGAFGSLKHTHGPVLTPDLMFFGMRPGPSDPGAPGGGQQSPSLRVKSERSPSQSAANASFMPSPGLGFDLFAPSDANPEDEYDEDCSSAHADTDASVVS